MPIYRYGELEMLTLSYKNAVRVLTGYMPDAGARRSLAKARARGSDSIGLPGRVVRVSYARGLFTVS